MRIAKGEYIALLDADDLFLPSYIEKKLSFLEQNPDYHFVYSDFIDIDEIG
ncbi:MAG: hypothetical protein KatS3mg035_1499 [Bacteroidia bacterium]|nr:MAG: hypothetical protein KatS3mg035_1499 [Bacteroidia bacterium]